METGEQVVYEGQDPCVWEGNSSGWQALLYEPTWISIMAHNTASYMPGPASNL